MYDIERVLSILPRRVASEILRLCDSRRADARFISEIRLRCIGASSILLSGERIFLCSAVSFGDASGVVSALCGGSLYAHRESIRHGYITVFGGVRVGICGQARYEGGALVGVSNITSLAFRIPTARCESAEALYEAWTGVRSGMIIYSRAGVGKTTALRSLTALIGGRGRMQVAVIDERCEFFPEDYKGASVDVYRGYKRCEGIEIALRTLSPDVIVIDEIGGRGEALAMLQSLNSGVRLIATAHADSYAELSRRVSLAPFFENRIFDFAARLSLDGGKRGVEIQRIDG